MELKQFLIHKKITGSELAKRAKLRQPYFSLIVNKKRTPSPAVALRISEATGGAVSIMELLFPNEKGQGVNE